MFWITEAATLVCKHQLGKVQNVPTQDLVKIGSRRLLVRPNPEGKAIAGCPNYGPSIKPCTTTLLVQEGYSDWIRVQGRSVCLDTVTGYTDGTPPGVVKYIVIDSGQHWVSEK
ncbi:MAG: hypothetical protein OEM00_06235 [Burkholderiaceae bacterium]|nr:hypothetical protein [Burkholderiaceae bacterium]